MNYKLWKTKTDDKGKTWHLIWWTGASADFLRKLGHLAYKKAWIPFDYQVNNGELWIRQSILADFKSCVEELERVEETKDGTSYIPDEKKPVSEQLNILTSLCSIASLERRWSQWS